MECPNVNIGKGIPSDEECPNVWIGEVECATNVSTGIRYSVSCVMPSPSLQSDRFELPSCHPAQDSIGRRTEVSIEDG